MNPVRTLAHSLVATTLLDALEGLVIGLGVAVVVPHDLEHRLPFVLLVFHVVNLLPLRVVLASPEPMAVMVGVWINVQVQLTGRHALKTVRLCHLGLEPLHHTGSHLGPCVGCPNPNSRRTSAAGCHLSPGS